MKTGRPKKQQWEMKVPKTVALSQACLDRSKEYMDKQHPDYKFRSFSQFVEIAIELFLIDKE